jgi:hypothetical protein
MDVTEILDEFVIPTFPENLSETLGSFVLDVGQIFPLQGECLSCGKLFDLTHPVYQKVGVCPFCAGNKIDDKGLTRKIRSAASGAADGVTSASKG